MDDGERVPIVIEQPAEAAANETLRDDGTLVIDIKAEAPGCEQQEASSNPDEIVVCAEGSDQQYMMGEDPPPAPNPMDELSESLRFNIGPIELGSIRNADGTYGFGARMKF